MAKKKPPAKRTVGRPKKYDPEQHPRIGKWLARDGKTQVQIAEALGINAQTLVAWKKKFPEFANAIKDGKDSYDNQVVDALYSRALGFEYTEEAIAKETDEKGRARAVLKRVQKRALPDVRAIELWLRNRRPEEWRQSSGGGSLDYAEIARVSAEIERIARGT